MKSELFLLIMSITFLFILLMYGIHLVNDETMAKSGLQQCLENNQVLWKKECDK